MNNFRYNLCLQSKQTTCEKPDRKKRLYSLDKLKSICSFFIICIHAPFPGVVGEYFAALMRIAVPIFLIITGYFYSPAYGPRQVKKLAKLMFGSNGIFFVWKLGRTFIKGESILSFLQTTFTVKNMATFVLLNKTNLQSHLWYLGAILYVVVIVTVLFRWNEQKGWNMLRLLSPFLLLGDLVLGKYSLLLLHREFPYILVRNWLFVGLPYFTIGMWLQKRKIRIGKWKLIGVIALTIVTTLLERYLLSSNDLNPRRDHYLSTTFLAVAVFLYFLHHISNKENLISQVGERDSTWIYILHPIFITVLDKIINTNNAESLYYLVRPIIVYLTTTIVVEIIMRIKRNLVTIRS